METNTCWSFYLQFFVNKNKAQTPADSLVVLSNECGITTFQRCFPHHLLNGIIFLANDSELSFIYRIHTMLVQESTIYEISRQPVAAISDYSFMR
jgi:hypothetical protein